MKPSTRYFAWSPMLLVGAALLLGLIASLQSEPCADERHATTATRLMVAAFMVYFFAGYWLAVTRKYVALSIFTIWAWHLLTMAPYVAVRCSEQRRLDELLQSVGIGMPAIVMSIAFVAIAGSVALLGYRTVEGAPAQGRIALLRSMAASLTIVSGVLAAAAYWSGARLRQAYAQVGSDLPGPTFAVLDLYPYAIVAPAVCAIIFICLLVKGESFERKSRLALNTFIGLFVLANVAWGVFLFSALAPVKTMCGCV